MPCSGLGAQIFQWTLWLALCPRTLNSVSGATAGPDVRGFPPNTHLYVSETSVWSPFLPAFTGIFLLLLFIFLKIILFYFISFIYFWRRRSNLGEVWNSAAEEKVQIWRGSHTLELQPTSKWVQYSPLTVCMQAWKTMSRMCICGGGGM